MQIYAKENVFLTIHRKYNIPNWLKVTIKKLSQKQKNFVFKKAFQPKADDITENGINDVITVWAFTDKYCARILWILQRNKNTT